jgi:hypothetical protein
MEDSLGWRQCLQAETLWLQTGQPQMAFLSDQLKDRTSSCSTQLAGCSLGLLTTGTGTMPRLLSGLEHFRDRGPADVPGPLGGLLRPWAKLPDQDLQRRYYPATPKPAPVTAWT